MQVEISDKQALQLIADARASDQSNQLGRLTLMRASRAVRDAGLVAVATDLDRADDLFFAGQERLHRLIQVLPKPSLPLDKLPAPGLADDLALLSTIGGRDLCELLALLERAQAVAEKIDEARGFTVGNAIPLQPGESRGTDLAESVSLLALRVRQEARGGVSPHE